MLWVSLNYLRGSVYMANIIFRIHVRLCGAASGRLNWPVYAPPSYSINHSESTIIFVSQEHLPALIAVAPRCPHLRVIVSIDDLTDSARRVAGAWAKEYKLELYTMKESESFLNTFILGWTWLPNKVEAMGAANPYRPNPPKPDDIATICYTSGTTNVPKGVLLTHFSLVSGVIAFIFGSHFDDGAMLSYLPLSHICEYNLSDIHLTFT